MEHELIIHMGMPKTGTTSLQFLLGNNNKVLMKNSFFYPDTLKHFNNTDMSAEGRFQNAGWATYKGYVIQNDDCWKEEFEEFTRTIYENLKKYNVILSDETLGAVKSDSYFEFMKGKYENVKVVVYIRRQDFRIESAWAGRIKVTGLLQRVTRDRTLKLQDFYNIKLEENHNLKCYDKLQQIENIVGKDNLKVFLYDELKGYGIPRHFVETLGLNYNDFKPVENQNIPLSVMDTEIKRRLNLCILGQTDRLANKINKEYWKLKIFFDDKRGYLLEEEDRRRILDYYEEDNRNIARTYFNREKLFDEKIDYPTVKLSDEEVNANYTTLLEKMMQNFAAITEYQANFIRKIIQGKKLALFGAGNRCRYLMNEGWKVDVILDNDRNKSGEFIGGVKVVYAEDFNDWSTYICLITVKESSEISEQLKSIGLIYNEDYFDINEIELLN
jgi:hypothetical protein